jgi:hypothetical protein
MSGGQYSAGARKGRGAPTTRTTHAMRAIRRTRTTRAPRAKRATPARARLPRAACRNVLRSLVIAVMNYRRHGAAAARFADRRRREDDAPRLVEVVPDLRSLRFDMEERSGATGAQPRHTRHCVVDHAPALFLVPCGDPRCADGEHDLTESVMRALRAHQTKFEGDDECAGSVGSSACGRVLHFEAVAEYRA